jgi:hypothetical protein
MSQGLRRSVEWGELTDDVGETSEEPGELPKKCGNSWKIMWGNR